MPLKSMPSRSRKTFSGSTCPTVRFWIRYSLHRIQLHKSIRKLSGTHGPGIRRYGLDTIWLLRHSGIRSLAHQAEAGNGIYYSKLGDQPYFWIGKTSRDQYSGVVFGLSVAYDMIDKPDVRGLIQQDLTRILNYLLAHNWNVTMPDGTVSTTFAFRPDQQLSFLQTGRRINPQRFALTYAIYRSVYAAFVGVPVFLDDLDDHNHYFKFNLNYINLYDLIRLEEDGSPYKAIYMNAYDRLRRTTQQHGNPHFNMVDRAL